MVLFYLTSTYQFLCVQQYSLYDSFRRYIWVSVTQTNKPNKVDSRLKELKAGSVFLRVYTEIVYVRPMLFCGLHISHTCFGNALAVVSYFGFLAPLHQLLELYWLSKPMLDDCSTHRRPGSTQTVFKFAWTVNSFLLHIWLCAHIKVDNLRAEICLSTSGNRCRSVSWCWWVLKTALVCPRWVCCLL